MKYERSIDVGDGPVTLASLHALWPEGVVVMSPSELAELNLCLAEPPRILGADLCQVNLPIRIRIER